MGSAVISAQSVKKCVQERGLLSLLSSVEEGLRIVSLDCQLQGTKELYIRTADRINRIYGEAMKGICKLRP